MDTEETNFHTLRDKTRPERYSVLVPASETAVAVKLHFVEPFRSFGECLNGEGVHRLDKAKFSSRQGAQFFAFHDAFTRCCSVISAGLRADEGRRKRAVMGVIRSNKMAK